MRRDESFTPLTIALGEALRFYRKELGLTQEGMGERAEIHPTWVSHLESGRLNPTLSSLRRLSDALEIKTSDLIALAERLEQGKPGSSP